MKDVLPEGWTVARLGEIAEVNPRHPKGIDDSTVVSFATMAAISDSKPEFEFLQERRLGDVRQGFTHFAEGDVLFAKITPCMENGKGAVATGLRNGIGCGTTELHVIRPCKGVDPHYIYRYLAQPSVRRAAEEHFTGTAGQARVPKTFIEGLEIPLAPFSEQRRIVAKLEELLSRAHECDQRLRRVPALLRLFRSSVLRVASSGRLTANWRRENGLSSMNWSETTVAGVLAAPLANGRSVPGAISGFPVLRLTCLKEGRIDLTERKIGAWSASDAKRFLVAKDDFLVSRGSGSLSHVGRGGLVEDQPDGVAYPDTMIRLRVREDTIDPYFFRLLWNARPLRDQIESAAHTTAGIWKISQRDILDFVLQVPSIGEQHEIVRRVRQFTDILRHIEFRLTAELARVEKLAAAVLSKAFSGELMRT